MANKASQKKMASILPILVMSYQEGYSTESLAEYSGLSARYIAKTLRNYAVLRPKAKPCVRLWNGYPLYQSNTATPVIPIELRFNRKARQDQAERIAFHFRQSYL